MIPYKVYTEIVKPYLFNVSLKTHKNCKKAQKRYRGAKPMSFLSTFEAVSDELLTQIAQNTEIIVFLDS